MSVASVLRDAARAVARWSEGLTPGQATLVTGSAVLLVGGITLWQKLRNDKRDQWWKRAQWAIELALDPDDNVRQETGFAAITHLAGRREATRGDRILLWKIVTSQLESDFEAPPAGLDTSVPPDHDGAEAKGINDGIG